LWILRQQDGSSLALVLPYILSQVLGAIVASTAIRFIMPADATLGATLPAGSAMQSFVLEVILTMILMWCILSVSTGAKERGSPRALQSAP
jgi:aquaporin Z